MTPPDRIKRPSARPAARPSSPPPSTAPVTPPARDAELESESSAKTRVNGKKTRPRASARRASIAPPASTPVASAKAEAKASAPVATKVPATPAPVSVPSPASARATVPARPAAQAQPKVASAASALIPAPAKVPYERAATDAQVEDAPAPPVLDDDGDVFGDSGAVPMAAVRSYALPSEDEDTEADEGPARGRDRLAKSSSGHRKRDEVALVGSAQELDTNDYYFRQYGAQAIRNLSAEVDDFGLDPHFEERARPALEILVKRYFRVDVDGADHLPASGRALIVANHAGALPWDGLVLRTALRVARPSLPPVRWLAEDTVFHYPFLGVTMNRLGAVRACQENAERLLAQDRLVAVFPEGAQGSSKLFRDRYRLQRFGRGGYVKLALKLGAPIIPTAIIGAEETNPLLARVSGLGRALGANYLPITPTFPWLGPLGLLPAPVKWRVVVGEPIDLSSYGEDSADDALVVHRLNEQIRAMLQSLVDQAKASRRNVLFG